MIISGCCGDAFSANAVVTTAADGSEQVRKRKLRRAIHRLAPFSVVDHRNHRIATLDAMRKVEKNGRTKHALPILFTRRQGKIAFKHVGALALGIVAVKETAALDALAVRNHHDARESARWRRIAWQAAESGEQAADTVAATD